MMMHQKPTVYVPPWSFLFDEAPPVGPVSGVTDARGGGLLNEAALAALQRYNQSHNCGGDPCEGSDDGDVQDSAVDAYSCDEFRMYEFKVRRCARGRSHDWTECPYAHPGEKARRRDPRRYHYGGAACPDFRKGSCKRGDACDMAHGVFECWLHPAKYRTQPCKDGTACRRRVCFFAHTPDQLRLVPQSPKTPLEGYDGSPLRHHQHLFAASPPMSPTGAGGCVEVRSQSPPMSPEEAVLASLRKLQLGKVNSVPPGRGFGPGFGSPRGGGGSGGGAISGFQGGFCSLPATPTRVFSGFGSGLADEEEEHVERVESGRALRARLYERLSKDSVMEKLEAAPDVGWVSDLLQ